MIYHCIAVGMLICCAGLSSAEPIPLPSDLEERYHQLLGSEPDEQGVLNLGHALLMRSQLTQDPESYDRVKELFAKFSYCLSPDGRERALLLQANYAPDYAMRDQLFRHLTQENHQITSCYGESWYRRGINDFNEGILLSSQEQDKERVQMFERSAVSFQNAFNQFKDVDPAQAAMALKYQAQSLHASGDLERSQEALSVLNRVIQDSSLLMSLKNPDEIFYLHALIAAWIAEVETSSEKEVQAESSLKEALARFPKGEWSDRELYLLGAMYERQKRYDEAEKIFLEIPRLHPDSDLAAPALFFAGRAAASQQAENRKREHFVELYDRYPNSSYAPEAYFSLYSYQDYVQGDRAALKHLEALPKKYADSPYALHAFYLMGLDYKRDRKTPEGKWLRKKNLPAAIEAFNQVEISFDHLNSLGKLPEEELGKLISMRYRAMLERALTNFQVAEESQGMKKNIFLVYAEELLQKLLVVLHQAQSENYRSLEEESGYWLVKIKIALGKEDEAENAIAMMLDKYRSAKINRSYFLSRLLYEWAMLGVNKEDYVIALERFKQAEDASKGNLLGSDQRLDLWIRQSDCYCSLQEYDQALLVLSQVINDDTVSGLRLKAMALRAEVYEKQGRSELARRQWEALEKKGGFWAAEAKQHLIENYGYSSNHFK